MLGCEGNVAKGSCKGWFSRAAPIVCNSSKNLVKIKTCPFLISFRKKK